jgi:hypothetical protein
VDVVFDGALLADYFQVFIADARHHQLPEDYPEEVATIRLQEGKGALVFTTARNMTVPVRVVLHPKKPNVDLSRVDHAVMGSFRTSGRVMIAGLMDYLPDAARFSVPAGTICALFLSEGLGTLSFDGLDGEDRYSVHLWPCQLQGVTVLRQWQE